MSDGFYRVQNCCKGCFHVDCLALAAFRHRSQTVADDSGGNAAEPRQSGRTAMRWSEEERRKGKGRSFEVAKREEGKNRKKEVEVIGGLFGQKAEKWKREREEERMERQSQENSEQAGGTGKVCSLLADPTAPKDSTTTGSSCKRSAVLLTDTLVD